MNFGKLASEGFLVNGKIVYKAEQPHEFRIRNEIFKIHHKIEKVETKMSSPAAGVKRNTRISWKYDRRRKLTILREKLLESK